MSSKATDVFRNWKVNGVPSSGENEPSKSEIRAWGTWLESISVAGLGDAVWKSNQALLYADLAHAADIVAIVYADTTAANNGIYVKVGASGAGNWTQVTKFLPGYQFINGEDDGTSTANSYHIDASPIAPADDGSALVSFVVPVTNTNANVSVSFNGGAPFTIKTASGSAPVVGGLVQNMPVLGICIGSNFYMRSDQPTAAIQAATEAARNAAQAAQAAAEAAAASVSLPLITGKAGQVLAVKTDGSGLEYIPLNIAFVESRAYAIGSYHPVAAPTFLKVCGYSAVGDCPDALYVKVASAPTHAGKFSITTLGGATVWYELSRNQDIYAEFFGAIANQTDADALADDGTVTTAAIIAGRTFLRGRSTNLTTNGLTGAPVTAYTSGVLNLGRGIFASSQT